MYNRDWVGQLAENHKREKRLMQEQLQKEQKELQVQLCREQKERELLREQLQRQHSKELEGLRTQLSTEVTALLLLLQILSQCVLLSSPVVVLEDCRISPTSPHSLIMCTLKYLVVQRERITLSEGILSTAEPMFGSLAWQAIHQLMFWLRLSAFAKPTVLNPTKGNYRTFKAMLNGRYYLS